MLVTEIKTISTTDPSKMYTVSVEKAPDRVSCDCFGCRVHGYCKHIKFYKKTIWLVLGYDTDPVISMKEEKKTVQPISELDLAIDEETRLTREFYNRLKDSSMRGVNV